MTVYGPYRRKDGRQVVIHYNNGKRRTQSYPRYLMEIHLNRNLEDWEHVDHINNDPTDDRIENLQILSQLANNRKYFDTNPELKAKFITCICPTCKTEFSVRLSQVKHNQDKQGKSGPFCSKSCAGRAC